MKKSTKLKQPKKQLKESNKKLAIANNTVFEQIAEIAALNKINEMQERHFKIAEAEMKRKDIIIGYLEIKILEGVEK